MGTKKEKLKGKKKKEPAEDISSEENDNLEDLLNSSNDEYEENGEGLLNSNIEEDIEDLLYGSDEGNRYTEKTSLAGLNNKSHNEMKQNDKSKEHLKRKNQDMSDDASEEFNLREHEDTIKDIYQNSDDEIGENLSQSNSNLPSNVKVVSLEKVSTIDDIMKRAISFKTSIKNKSTYSSNASKNFKRSRRQA